MNEQMCPYYKMRSQILLITNIWKIIAIKKVGCLKLRLTCWIPSRKTNGFRTEELWSCIHGSKTIILLILVIQNDNNNKIIDLTESSHHQWQRMREREGERGRESRGKRRRGWEVTTHKTKQGKNRRRVGPSASQAIFGDFFPMKLAGLAPLSQLLHN